MAPFSWRTGATVRSICRTFPADAGPGRKAIDQVEELLRLRGIIGQAIEHARQEKVIGNTLEARVVLNSDSDVTDKIPKEELEEFFILSDLTIHRAEGTERFGNENALQKMRPLLATSADCRHEQSAPGFVRSVRERGGRNDEVRMTNVEGMSK